MRARIAGVLAALLAALTAGAAASQELPAELSGGQKQRVGIARALAAEPDWMLMDEPFGAVDPLTRVQLRTLFSELRKSRQVTTVLVTHDLEDAFALADRIAILKQGRLVQVGTPQELVESPQDSWVRDFIQAGARPSLIPPSRNPAAPPERRPL